MQYIRGGEMMKNKKIIYAVTSFALIAVVGITGFFLTSQSADKEVQYLNASWTYNYKDIKEITLSSDFVALVRVENEIKNYKDSGIPFTEFNVKVIEPVYGADLGENFTIVMTGANTADSIVEVKDDPLLEANQEYFIFGRQNKDGTITILSGPQGRLEYTNGKLNSLQVNNSRVREANPNMNINIVDANVDELINEIKTVIKDRK